MNTRILRVTGCSFALLLVLSLVACAGQPAPANEPASDGQPTSAVEQPAAEQPQGQLPAGATPVRVVFLTIQPFSPFEGDVWAGIQRAKADGYASEVKLIEFKEPSEYEEGVQAVSEDGFDVVIATFELLKPAITAVAPKFPDTHYVNVWVSAPEPADQYKNVRGYIYNVEDGSYVNGVIAAKMCGDHVGFVGGDDNAVILRFLAGFEAGVKTTNPNMTLDVAWAGTYIDPVKGREVALSLFQRGSNCIMTAANKTGLGVINAGQEVGKPIFGVDIDQSKDAPDTVVSSALANAGESAYRSIVDTVTDQWTGGTIYFGADDDVPAVAINMGYPEGFPEGTLEAAQEAESKIASGEIKVPETTTTR